MAKKKVWSPRPGQPQTLHEAARQVITSMDAQETELLLREAELEEELARGENVERVTNDLREVRKLNRVRGSLRTSIAKRYQGPYS